MDMSHTEIEVIHHRPDHGARHAPPLLFVHGAFAGAWCWNEHFLPWFAAQGFESYALSLSGHGNSLNSTALDAFSVSDYVGDLAEVIDDLPTPPVLIGHSMGGLVVQKYLEDADVPAVCLVCSVPPQGLFMSALSMFFRNPYLMLELNRVLAGHEANIESLREALFHQPIDESLLRRYYAMSQPESHRAIWDMTFFNLPQVARIQRPPMLVLGAEHDRLIPPDQVVQTAETYGVEAEILSGFGHGVMLEARWQEAAACICNWLSSLGYESRAS